MDDLNKRLPFKAKNTQQKHAGKVGVTSRSKLTYFKHPTSMSDQSLSASLGISKHAIDLALAEPSDLPVVETIANSPPVPAKRRSSQPTHASQNKPEQPPTICKFFLESQCRKGASCSFSHEAIPHKKQENCKFFLSGSCLRGDGCVFSHDFKHSICKFFESGKCTAGEACRFSHDSSSANFSDSSQTLVSKPVHHLQPKQETPLTLLPTSSEATEPNFLDPFASPF